MTNKNDDSFAAPDAHTGPQDRTPPRPSPGVIPGASGLAPSNQGPVYRNPAAPPPPPGFEPEPPRKLALWAMLTTGLVTALAVVAAAMGPASVERTKEILASGETSFSTGGPMDFVSLPAQILAYIMLALWMSRIRRNLTVLGAKPGGPPAVEWWGWIVPVGNLVLPFLGMRALTKSSINIAGLLGWWLPWIASGIFTALASVASLRAVDFTTGELTNPEALDVMVPMFWAAAISLLVSWVFLTIIIRQTTTRHLEEFIQ